LEGEENVAKKARRLSFDERSCTVNTLEDDLENEDDGGFYDDYATTTRTTSRGSPTPSPTAEICCLYEVFTNIIVFSLFSPRRFCFRR